jgi:hypothetical protein
LNLMEGSEYLMEGSEYLIEGEIERECEKEG